jgi:hypothetical protein
MQIYYINITLHNQNLQRYIICSNLSPLNRKQSNPNAVLNCTLYFYILLFFSLLNCFACNVIKQEIILMRQTFQLSFLFCKMEGPTLWAKFHIRRTCVMQYLFLKLKTFFELMGKHRCCISTVNSEQIK